MFSKVTQRSDGVCTKNQSVGSVEELCQTNDCTFSHPNSLDVKQ